MDATVVFNNERKLEELGGGVCRKVLAYNEQIMMVEVVFETGGTGSVHVHPHVQSTYVRSGRFRFDINGESVEVADGDSIVFPSGIPHGTLCLEAGTLIDVFTPMREDFVR